MADDSEHRDLPESPPPPSRTYWLAADGLGRQIVSVHVKYKYILKDDGRLVRSDEEDPLLLGAPPEQTGFNETDVIPFKQNTDLIVLAKAWGHGATSILAGIQVGDRGAQYCVTGDRYVAYQGSGSWRFSDPEPFESIEMRYENAYGGFDGSVPLPERKHIIDMFDLDPGLYPRNTVGKGYVVYENKARIDGLALPNIEHPGMMLRPGNLVVGGPEHWWRAPLPWSCEWFDKTWYPRMVYYRGIPDHIPVDDRVMPEVALGWLDPGHATEPPDIGTVHPYDNRIGDAASPAWVLPTMRGDEAVELVNLTPNGRIVVQLPGDPPAIRVRYRDKEQTVPAVPHRVLISTIDMAAYIVWHGAWYPPRSLPERPFEAGEPYHSALSGVAVFVDHAAVAPLGAETR